MKTLKLSAYCVLVHKIKVSNVYFQNTTLDKVTVAGLKQFFLALWNSIILRRSRNCLQSLETVKLKFEAVNYSILGTIEMKSGRVRHSKKEII